MGSGDRGGEQLGDRVGWRWWATGDQGGAWLDNQGGGEGGQWGSRW